MAHSTLPAINERPEAERSEPATVHDRPLGPQPVPVAASVAVDEEPDRLRRRCCSASAAAPAFLDPRPSAIALAAFAIFCALSGVVYLINDVADREADRLHPLKRYRPIASGAVSPSLALGTAAVAGGRGARRAPGCCGRRSRVAADLRRLLALYSGPLKHVVIIDVLTIAIGFVLRAAGGAVAIDVPISHWLLILTILLALFLALSKRRHELVLLADGATSHRPILEEYSPYLLDQMIAVVTASTLISYVIYTVSPETVQKFHTDYLGLTLVFPLYGIFRYLYLVHQKEGGGSPSDMLLNDRPLLAVRGAVGA